MEEHGDQNQRHRNNSVTGTESGKSILLFCICFGVLCIVQASLNVCLRLFLQSEKHPMTEERDKLKLKLQNIDDYASEGWMYFQGSVYLGSSTEQSWQQCRKFCQQRAADLIIIASEQEQKFANVTFEEQSWIGLSDAEQEGVWKWVDGSPLSTSFWNTGEPNNMGDEDCAELKHKNKCMNWNDLGCSNKRKCICEKEI